MRLRCALVGLIATLCAGCTQDAALSRDERPASAEQLARANQVARAYLDAAAEADTSRMCALRTQGSVSRWGGRAACEHRARGLLLGPYRHSVPWKLKQRLARRGQAVDAASARIVPADTSGTGDDARVVVDFGKAFIEDGHANGGDVIEIELKRERGDYRVARVGFASFAD